MEATKQTAHGTDVIGGEIRTAARHSAIYGLGNVLAKALGFLMLPVYTRFLNTTDYGVLEILDLSMSLIGMFLNMGITASVLRSYAAAPTEREKNETISTAFWFLALVAAVTVGLFWCIVRPLSAMIFGPKVPFLYLMLSFLAFAFGFVATLPRTYLRALDASGIFVALDTAALFLMLCLNILFIAILKVGLIGILLSSLLVAALQAVILSWWMLRKVGFGYQGNCLRAMLAFGGPLVLSNMSLFTLNFSDRFFLQHLRSLDVVGIYAVGYKFGYMLNYLLVQPFFVMWQARMFAIYALADHKVIFERLFTLYALMLIYAGLALAMLSPEIVRVMVAPNFAACQTIIPIVALAYVFYGIGYYVQVGMYVTGKTWLIGAVGGACAVVNLALNYGLIRFYGMLGAAWATLISFLAIMLASYWIGNRVLPLSLRIGKVGLAFAVALGLYGLSWYPAPFGIVVIVGIKVLLLALFPIAVWKFGILSPDERQMIAETTNHAAAAAFRTFGWRPRKVLET
jgi:O-antigen/teichoic acid export membrane protein